MELAWDTLASRAPQELRRAGGGTRSTYGEICISLIAERLGLGACCVGGGQRAEAVVRTVVAGGGGLGGGAAPLLLRRGFAWARPVGRGDLRGC